MDECKFCIMMNGEVFELFMARFLIQKPELHSLEFLQDAWLKRY